VKKPERSGNFFFYFPATIFLQYQPEPSILVKTDICFMHFLPFDKSIAYSDVLENIFYSQ